MSKRNLWLRALLVFVVVFSIDRFGFGKPVVPSLIWATVVAAIAPSVTYLRRADGR